jgi:chemotaxis protein MotB
MSHGGGGDAWLVSYADFITLLMVLFVVLYSMGQTDVERYKQLAESLRAGFAGGGAVNVVDPGINTHGGSSENDQPSPITISDIPKAPPDTQQIATQLTRMLTSSEMGSQVSVQNNIEGILISLSEHLVFVPGHAELQPGAYPVLDKVAEMARTSDMKVRVVGHTDNAMPADPKYPTNWELSTARAISIVNYLISAGIDPNRMIASGRADTEPIFPNDTPEHRALNSRADIVFIYPVTGSFIDFNLGDSAADISVEVPALEPPAGEGE